MRKILLCEPNISEGRDLSVVEHIADEIRSDPAIKLMDYSSDPNHNRSVFTYLGEPEPVLEATERLAVMTFELIDMTLHTGSHPRQGALDVAPFIPVRGIETAEAVEVARRFGRYVGGLGVPVYYYEDAATRPERKNLPDIRKGDTLGNIRRFRAAATPNSRSSHQRRTRARGSSPDDGRECTESDGPSGGCRGDAFSWR